MEKKQHGERLKRRQKKQKSEKDEGKKRVQTKAKEIQNTTLDCEIGMSKRQRTKEIKKKKDRIK